MTALACFPEPPCDCFTERSWEVFCFHCLAKALLKSWYSSRVGSYETFSNSVFAKTLAGDSSPKARITAAIAPHCMIKPPEKN